MEYSHTDLLELEKRFRANLINSIPGFKPVVLIGTKSKSGVENVAPFNSVVHIGANPPFLGFIQRPTTVERHTFENIIETKYYTFNLITPEFLDKAHQSAARYEKTESEFEATGLIPEYKNGFFAPFVKDSPVQIGLEISEVVDIKSNGTKLVIGAIKQLSLPENITSNDGFVNLTLANIVAAIGLDAYATPNNFIRFSYAKANQELKITSKSE
jgi:flavin reductase (DIM6/NTAB) family NADH-FMN oxidoreductase RutF